MQQHAHVNSGTLRFNSNIMGKKPTRFAEIMDPTDPPFTHEMDPSSGSKH
jgi:hypothetical protein